MVASDAPQRPQVRQPRETLMHRMVLGFRELRLGAAIRGTIWVSASSTDKQYNMTFRSKALLNPGP